MRVLIHRCRVHLLQKKFR